MKYQIITYGCQMNRSDSERIAAVLEKIEYKKTLKKDDADLIVVNMCSVRQSAVDRVYGKLNQISSRFQRDKNQNDKLKCKVILTGCILPKDKKKLKSRVDLILNIKNLTNWPKFLKPTTKNPKLFLKQEYFSIAPKYKNKFSAFIPISNGCNNACSYCAVPYTRGRLVCREAEKILTETKEAIKNGAKEIWILGQNVNDYQCPNDNLINFAKLLEMINDIPGDFWVRFTSPHPKNFSDELIKTMSRCEKITPYLNLPVQSGDNTILKKMNRSYNIAQYKRLIKKIRKKIPNVALSTDVIVGFPGETKKQFENTAKLMKEIKFDMAYIAKYSPRPGTAAVKLKDNISPKEKDQREKTLTEILKKTSLKNNKKYIGKTVNVLADKYKDGFLIGKSFHYKTVKLKGLKNLIGKIIKVKVTDALPWGLKGKSSH